MLDASVNVAESAVWFETALLPDGWAHRIRISHAAGRITRVQVDVDADRDDERADIGLPGLANLHSHAFQRGMAGLAEVRGPSSDDFWTWREVMYRFVDRLTPEQLEAITAMAYVEMLESGFTRVGEFHYLHHDVDGRPYGDPAEMAVRVASAAAETGIGLTLLPVFYAHGGFGGAPPAASQRRFITRVEDYFRLLEKARDISARLEGATVGVAPHSLRAVTPDELGSIVSMAGRGPIHIHAAEQTREVEDCLAWSGQRPVEWLLNHVDIDSRWCLVHATHVTNEEATRLARSGAVVGLCPITEANLGDGLFPAADYLREGGRIGVGSDSNVRIDAAEELRLMEYGQRLRWRARNVLSGTSGQSTGRALFEKALLGGAQALGVAGGLEEGAPADFLSLDVRHPAFAGRTGDALLDSWIFAASKEGVAEVWCRGCKVVHQGRHRGRDAVLDRFRRTLKVILQS